MVHEDGGYMAYLLRLWPVHNGESTLWRASLENPYSGERHGFVDLEELLRFLEQETRRQENERRGA